MNVAGWLVGCLVGRLFGRSVGWVIGCLIGWLADCSYSVTYVYFFGRLPLSGMNCIWCLTNFCPLIMILFSFPK